MLKRKVFACCLFLSATFLHGQGAPGPSNYPANVLNQSGAPSGNCTATNVFYVNSANGNLYSCPIVGAAWVLSGNAAGAPSALGVLGQPSVYTAANGIGSSAQSLDCSKFSVGSTLDVIQLNCESYVMTGPASIADMRALGTGSGSQAINSLVQWNQLIAPTLTKVSSGTGTAYSTGAVVTVAYTITSPTGTTASSSEASVTITDGTCPGSGNCFVQMTSPTYFGTGTTYTSYQATSTGYAELACPVLAIGVAQGFGSGAGGCNGAAVPSGSNPAQLILLPALATWTCPFTGTNCILVMDHAMVVGNIPGSSGGMRIDATGASNFSDALVGTDRNAKNAGGVLDAGSTYVKLGGFQPECTAGGSVCNDVLRWSALADSSKLYDVQAIGTSGCAIETYSTGYTYWDNIHGDGFQTVNSGSTAVPLCIGKSGSAIQTSILATKLVLVHPGGSNANLKYRGGNASVVIDQLDMEYQNNTASCGNSGANAMIDIGTDAAQGGMVSIGAINVGANCTGSTVVVVKLETNAKQIDIGELSVGGQAGVTPISDLRTGAPTATPYTQAQCTAGTPCNYHVGSATQLIGTSSVTPNKYVADTGAVNVYVATLVPPMTAYTTGVEACFKAANANTNGTPTVNFNGLGAKTIVKWGGISLTNSDIGTTEPSCVIYDGANFLLLNPQVTTGTGQQVLSNSPSFGTNVTTPKITAGTAGTQAGYIDIGEGVLTSAMTAQSTATCTNVTSMTWNISANKNYNLHCVLPITFAASATIAFCIGGPGTPTSHTINAVGSIGTAGVYDDIVLVNSATYGTKTAASGAVGASTQVVLLDAVVRNGATASGTALTLQTAGNGTNTFTMLADADCHLLQTN